MEAAFLRKYAVGSECSRSSWSIPFRVLGVSLGRQAYRRIPGQKFRTVVAVVLLALAALMVFSV